MTTEKAPTKGQFLEALSKNGINSLEDLADAILPKPDETGGFSTLISAITVNGFGPKPTL